MLSPPLGGSRTSCARLRASEPAADIAVPTARGGLVTGTQRDAAKIRERLVNVQDRLRRARASVRVLEEQVAHLEDVAADLETRKIVAQTPLADREWREARTDADRHVRLLEEGREEIAELQAERDRLLDRLLEGT